MRSTIVAALIALPALARAQSKPDTSHAGMAGMDHHSTAAAESSMNGPLHDDPHMLMTPKRVATAADSARAVTIVAEARRALEKYKDVQVAEADGFKQFLPNV
ncbi:MAG: hypothetical protein M3081_14830, partial [Gemmatimonadota bacterium]|nr:hypothetical protein [Gemmatimonadota bacterium]